MRTNTTKYLAFAALIVLIASGHLGQARDAGCPPSWPGPGNFYDGFNFCNGEYACNPLGPLSAACEQYCDAIPNDGGGCCDGVDYVSCSQFESNPTYGYCQCAFCIYCVG
jgi:hypothetical protein